MTDLDWAIVNELVHEPHVPARVIAARLGKTANQVVARLRKLDGKDAFHVIAGFDLKSLDKSFSFVFVSAKGRRLDEVAREISDIPETTIAASVLAGDFNLLVACHFADLEDLARIVYERIAAVAGVVSIQVALVLKVPVFRPVYLDSPYPILDDLDRLRRDIRAIYAPEVLDDTDVQILAEFQHDGRASINSVARKHDLNAGTVRYRIRALETRGVINFVTLLNPQVVSLGITAVLTMRIDAGAMDEAIRQLSERRWLAQLFLCAGTPAVIGLVIAESTGELVDLKAAEIDTIPGVLDATLLPLVEVFKCDVRWTQKPQQDL